MNDVKLTPTSHLILGMLSFGQDLSGYEIRGWTMGSVAHFYPAPAQSQIYSELTKLETAGLVIGKDVPQPDRPDKRAFSLTDAGRNALERWATGPCKPPTIKHHLALRAFLGHTAPTDELIPLLEEHRASLLSALDQLETNSVAMSGDPQTGNAGIVSDWVAEIYRGDLRGVDLTLKALRS